MALITQTTQPSLGRAGDLACSKDWETESKYSATPIAVGKVCLRDAEDNRVKIPTAAPAAGSAVMGVIQRDQMVEGSTDNIPANKEIKVLTRGKIFMTARSAVVEGETVAFLHTGPNAGDVVASGTADSTDLAGARFSHSAADGEVTIVDLMLP